MRMPMRRFIDRRIDAFLADPASPRKAIRVMVVLTVSTVLIGSLVIWLLDPEVDFPDYGTALWFTLQTVTTVGYGDVTPATPLGRTVAGIVMIVALAFMTIVTALVTSTFIDAAQSRRRAADATARDDASERLHARLDEIMDRLAALEARLAEVDGGAARPSEPLPPPSPASDPGSPGSA